MTPAAYRWDDWIPGAQHFAEQLQHIPGICLVRKAMATKRTSVPAHPSVVIASDDRLMAKYVHGEWVQLILLDLFESRRAVDIATQVDQLLTASYCQQSQLTEGLMSYQESSTERRAAISNNGSVMLTEQQAETYTFLLSLDKTNANRFSLDRVTSILKNQFNGQGTNRYMALLGKSLIVRQNGKTFVVRRPFVLGKRAIIHHPSEVTSPEQVASSAPSVESPSEPKATASMEEHFEFLCEHWLQLEPCRRLLAQADIHIKALKDQGWEIVDVNGEPLLRRITRSSI